MRTRVQPTRGFCGLFAEEPVRAGATIARLDGEVVDHPSTHSLQIGEHRHLMASGRLKGDVGDTCWSYLNHSCAPNTGISVESMSVVALRDIAAGEELTFNYLTTEREMDDPFRCDCGAPGCFRDIRGFAHLSPEQQAALADQAAPYLRGLVSA